MDSPNRARDLTGHHERRVQVAHAWVVAPLLLIQSTPARAVTWTPFTVTAPDGVQVPAIVSDPGDGQPHPTVVYLHGAPGARGATSIQSLATQGLPAQRWIPLLDAGFVVCVSDWRGHPPERPFDVLRGDVNATDDLAAVLDHLGTLPYVDAARVGLIGDSMGGGIILQTFLDRPLGPVLLCFPASGAFIGYSGPQTTGCTPAVTDAQVDMDSIFIRTAPITRAIHLQQGTSDGLCSQNRKLDELLLRGGKTATYSEFTGAAHGFTNGPDNAAFRAAIEETRQFFVTELSSPSTAPSVGGLAALHHDGQTFLTWNAPPGTGWRYRAYSSTTPITTTAQLDQATLVGSVGDSTWCDRRLSSLRGTIYGYAIDSLFPPLGASKGLLAVTPTSAAARWYAVTAQPAAGAEERTVAVGANALAASVGEAVGTPRPVYQRTLTQGALPFEVYTLWTSPTDTPLFPAMGTVHGLAFDCAVVRGTAGGGLMVRPHARGGNLLNGLGSTGEPGEWRLALDDHLFASSDHNSFWYGYHTGYDPFVAAPVTPSNGLVVDFTLRRIVHTLAWSRRSFPIDTCRVYAYGGSMGGIGSLMLAYRVPQWIAAIQAVIPKFDFSMTNDPNPGNLWNAGSPERAVGDHLWGTVAANLPCSDGMPVYDRLDEGVLAGLEAGVSLPPIFAFNGKNDTVVGWGEKIPYYAAVETHRHGGAYFFDQRTHNDGPTSGAWSPMQNTRDLYRFRTDRSYPALSRCSADDDPGNGVAANGDSVGGLNAFAEWDTAIVDRPTSWECTLRLRDLVTLWGAVPAPESLAVDVTPRRLQRFAAAPGNSIAWQVRRVSDGVVTQSGTVVADSLGLVTVPAMRIVRAGVVVMLAAPSALDARESMPPDRIALRVAAQPIRGAASLRVAWPSAGRAEVELFDAMGRRVRTLFRGEVTSGTQALVLDAESLSAGVFFIVARQGDARLATRVVVIR
jgi:dienelactone hydrolase